MRRAATFAELAWFPLNALCLAIAELYTDIGVIHGALAGIVTVFSIQEIAELWREWRFADTLEKKGGG